MSLCGKGAIIIWNGVTPEGRADFYDWHLHEHIPERLSIPGFLRGSRFIAVTPDTNPEFLTLYETQDAGVAMSQAYLARLNAPTEWTRRATSHFRDTLRALTHVEHSFGPGAGGYVATLRFATAPAGVDALAAVRANVDAMRRISRMPRISGVHLCVTDVASSAAKTVESRERKDISDAPIAAVIVQGCVVEAVAGAVAALVANLGAGASGVQRGIYRLEHTARGGAIR